MATTQCRQAHCAMERARSIAGTGVAVNGWDQARSLSAKWRPVPEGVPGAEGQCQRGAVATGNSRKESGHPGQNPHKPDLSEVKAELGEGQGTGAVLRLTLGLFRGCRKVTRVRGHLSVR